MAAGKRGKSTVKGRLRSGGTGASNERWQKVMSDVSLGC